MESAPKEPWENTNRDYKETNKETNKKTNKEKTDFKWERRGIVRN